MQQYAADAPDIKTGVKIMELINAHPILKSFLTGAFSGACSTLLFQPLDLVKTRLQNPARFSSGVNVGMVSLVFDVVRNERVSGLWKGTVPSVVRCVPGVGMYFCSLHWLESSLKIKNPGPLEAVCLGVVARSLAGITLLPVTVIKTRFESGSYSYNSLTNALHHLYKTEGRKGLFSGLIPTLFRDAPFSGLYLLFYTQTKKLIPSRWKPETSVKGSAPPLVFFLCGLTAGSLASLITHPADVIKTRMQLFPKKYSNLKLAVSCIYSEKGVNGFLQGLLPRLVRRTLMSAMAWTIYEQVMRGIGFH